MQPDVLHSACSVSRAATLSQSAFGLRPGSQLGWAACPGITRFASVWQSVCAQLGTASLEDLGVENNGSLSWKSPAGFAQQTTCYTLRALLDLTFSSNVFKLLDSDAAVAEAAADAIRCVLDSQHRLQKWLHGACRPKALSGAPPASCPCPACTVYP